MTKVVSVKFLRHAPPYMPGDIASFHPDKARDLHTKGIAYAGESFDAPIERATAEFDPAKSPIEEVRAFIVGRGETIPADATEAAIRKAADRLLKASK